MMNYREILRLSSLHYSQLQISASTSDLRDTIAGVLRLAQKHGIEWPIPNEL